MLFLNNTGEVFGIRTPGQSPTGPSWLSGDVEPAAKSKQDKKLSKSSEINNAWQFGATGSHEIGRQEGGLPDAILNDGTPGHSQRKQPRKRVWEDEGS